MTYDAGDTYPAGFGCPCCDGTGFVSDETLDRLRTVGHRVPWSEFPANEPYLDPDSDLGRLASNEKETS